MQFTHATHPGRQAAPLPSLPQVTLYRYSLMLNSRKARTCSVRMQHCCALYSVLT